MNKTNKIAIITGASSGIGLAVSKILVKKRIKVYMISHDKKKLNKAVKEVGASLVQPMITDVRNGNEVFETVEKIIKDNGKIDYLINCAGISIHGDFDKLEERDWDEVIDTNMKGVYFFCKAVWKHMSIKNQGHIITISSASGIHGYGGGSIYCASKFGVNGMMECLAIEGQKVGIKVTTICPGNVDTPILNPEDPDVIKERGNMLQTKDIAETIYFLLNRPKSDHFKQIVLLPFNLNFRISGKTRGPGGRFLTSNKI